MSFAGNILQASLTGWTPSSTTAFVSSVMASQVLGALWYSPLLFQDYWMSLAFPEVKNSQEFSKMQKTFIHPKVCYGSAMAGAVTGFFMLRGILRLTSTQSAIDGALVGIFLSSVDGVFGMMHPFFENRPFMLYVVNHAYHLTCFAMAGAVLATFATK